jgi:hypothetical protein
VKTLVTLGLIGLLAWGAFAWKHGKDTAYEQCKMDNVQTAMTLHPVTIGDGGRSAAQRDVVESQLNSQNCKW